MDNEHTLEEEAELIQQTDNSPRPEDGPQPPQSEPPKLIPEED